MPITSHTIDELASESIDAVLATDLYSIAALAADYVSSGVIADLHDTIESHGMSTVVHSFCVGRRLYTLEVKGDQFSNDRLCEVLLWTGDTRAVIHNPGRGGMTPRNAHRWVLALGAHPGKQADSKELVYLAEFAALLSQAVARANG